MKLPIRTDPPGPAVTVDRWYDRHSRNWVVQKMDADGNQIGNAEYVYSKREAILIEVEWKKEMGQ